MAEKVDNKNNEYTRDLHRSRTNIDRGGRLLPRDPNKPNFQKVLEDTGTSNESMTFTPQGQGSTTETKEAVRAAASQQERFSGGKEKDDFQKRLNEKEREHDEPAKTGESKESSGAPRAKEAERRVVGRGSLSERGHGGSEGGHGGGEGSGKQEGQRGQKGFVALPGSETGPGAKGEVKGIIHGSFEMELHAAQSLAHATPAAPPTKPLAANKALVDQIVQYCRVVTKTDGDKEIDMQLHEAIFKGLKLRVMINKDGQVVATFVTQSQEVLDLFNAQKSELKKTLAQKGIAVESINVIMV